jgi:hypothetical protein
MTNSKLFFLIITELLVLLVSCKNTETNKTIEVEVKKQEPLKNGYIISICQKGFRQSGYSDSIVYKYDGKRNCIDNRKYTYSKKSSNGRYYYGTNTMNEEVIKKPSKPNYSDTLLLDNKVIFIDSLNLNRFVVSIGYPDYIEYLIKDSDSYFYDSIQEILTLELDQELSIIGIENSYDSNGNSINVKKAMFFFDKEKLIKSIIYVENRIVILRHFSYKNHLLNHYSKEMIYTKPWGYKKAGRFKSDKYWIYVTED